MTLAEPGELIFFLSVLIDGVLAGAIYSIRPQTIEPPPHLPCSWHSLSAREASVVKHIRELIAVEGVRQLAAQH